MTDDVEGWDDLFAPAPAAPDEAPPLILTMPEEAWLNIVRASESASGTPDALSQPETGERALDALASERDDDDAPASVLDDEREVEIDAFMQAIESLDEVVESEEATDEDGLTLFGSNDDFRLAWQEWKGMPEFSQKNLAPYRSIMVHFASPEDVEAFGKLIDQVMPTVISARGVWFPKPNVAHYIDKRYISTAEEESND